MIVVLHRTAAPEDVDAVAARVSSLGMTAHVINGTERTVVAATGSEDESHRDALASLPQVESVTPILAPYKMASREAKPEPSAVTAGSLTVGGGVCGVIAGPCSVEARSRSSPAPGR